MAARKPWKFGAWTVGVGRLLHNIISLTICRGVKAAFFPPSIMRVHTISSGRTVGGRENEKYGNFLSATRSFVSRTDGANISLDDLHPNAHWNATPPRRRKPKTSEFRRLRKDKFSRTSNEGSLFDEHPWNIELAEGILCRTGSGASHRPSTTL